MLLFNQSINCMKSLHGGVNNWRSEESTEEAKVWANVESSSEAREVGGTITWDGRRHIEADGFCCRLGGVLEPCGYDLEKPEDLEEPVL